MSSKTYTRLGLVLFLILSALDLVHTYILIQQGGGKVYEGNPVARTWLHQYGWAGLALYKGATIFIVVCCVALLNRRNPRGAALVVTIACVILLAVAVYSRSLLAQQASRSGYFFTTQQTSFLPSRP